MTTRRANPRSTTRRDLLRLGVALLVVTAVACVGSLAAFTGVQSTIREVTARTAPAVLEVTAARWALVQADSEAMASFKTGQGQLTGPGEQYKSQIAIASQSLAHVAEHNSAGDGGIRTLQLVEGDLAAYGGWIEEADAHFRTGSTLLGATNLWYASQLMHRPNSGILATLDTLAGSQRKALSETLSTGWMNPAGMLVWIVPILLLLCLLGVAQVFLKRKFQRTVNPALAAATLLLLLVAGATAVTLLSQARANAVGQTVNQVVDKWEKQTRENADGGQRYLDVLGKCATGLPKDCGDIANAFSNGSGQEKSGSGAIPVQQQLAVPKQVNDLHAAADQSDPLGYLIPVGTVALVVLILFGLRRGIDEYRYRST